MNNKPVAWMHPDTLECGHGGNVDWEDTGCIPLYTHSVKELNDGGEPVKNATYWKRQYNLMASQNDNLKSGLYHANEQIKYLESHPVKELTDEEITQVFNECYPNNSDGDVVTLIDFARAILRKAQEK